MSLSKLIFIFFVGFFLYILFFCIFECLVDDGVWVVGYIYCHPGDDGIALPWRKAEVERPNQTLAGIAHCVQACLARHARAVVHEFFIVRDFSDVVDEWAVELEEESLFFWS